MELLRELGGLLYPWPVSCVCCRKDTFSRHALCPECLEILRSQPAITGFGGGGFKNTVAAHIYAGPGGALVRLLKYRTAGVLRWEMGQDMLVAARLAGMEKPDVVTYVPMHRRRRRGRYFDQAELLAREVAKEWGMKPVPMLIRQKIVKSQAGIRDDMMRMDNMKGVFAALPDVKGRRVLLIDDVFTTGATALDCLRALKAAGVAEVSLLTYALAHTAGGIPLYDDGPQPFDGEILPF